MNSNAAYKPYIEKGVLMIYFLLLSGSLALKVITPGNIAVAKGGVATLKCNLSIEKSTSITQSEWNRCNDKKVLVYHPEHGATITYEYIDRISDVRMDEFRIKETRENDTGEYCCIFTTFPSGKYEGKIVLELKDPPSHSTNWLIIYVVIGGASAVLVFGAVGLFIFQTRRRSQRIRNPVHISVHTGNSAKKHQCQDDKEGASLEEDIDDYFNVLTVRSGSNYKPINTTTSAPSADKGDKN
ncbi:T-cell immunoreceptor with Ig and ITIM domains-like [Acipenser ruthenus]|uniref:T-cell immunoreceptor with Ig and ITIM domains-like n=1 Tax=Acipenser ruthenus TaxID=7906 RepID=UPI0015618201|nr:T-cell immunoreceptor with Ig and ITIM domains-like [Acipenser ruthenus]XP_034778443.2 T-cell immunoreceptor with Ig and ITIM domains-like [Acipenser ruthenus]